MKRYESKRVRVARTAHHKEKRIEEKEAMQLYNTLSLSKWDFLRGKRREYEAMVGERTRYRTQVTMWLVHAYKDAIVRHVWAKFAEKRKAHKEAV